MGEGLTGEQAEHIQQASAALLEAMQAYGVDPAIDEAVKLVIKKGRVRGAKIRCQVDPPEGVGSIEWLSGLSLAIAALSGYGEVKVIRDSGGEVVGARVDVSYDFNHF